MVDSQQCNVPPDPHYVTPRLQSSIADDYPEVGVEVGAYGALDWDRLPAEKVRRHDALVAASPDEVETADLDGLSDFLRWAVARAALRGDLLDRFLEVARLILSTESDSRSALLDYDGVAIAAARALGLGGRAGDGLDVIDQWLGDERVVGQGARRELRLQRGLLLLRADRADEAAPDLIELASETVLSEPELSVAMAEELVQVGHRPLARRVLEAASRARDDLPAPLRSELARALEWVDATSDSGDVAPHRPL